MEARGKQLCETGFHPSLNESCQIGRVVSWRSRGFPRPAVSSPSHRRRIKTRFSRAVQESGERSASRQAKQERGLWQRRFREHCIRDEADFAMHVRYCRGNPVRHGVVASAVDWPNSSIHRDIRLGRVEPEWAGGRFEGEFGE